jgi:uncharacterized protein (DUF885 family)
MSKNKSAFEGLLSRYFERLMEEDPIFATTIAGVTCSEGRLGSLAPRFHANRERQRKISLKALEELSPRELSNEQQIDRLALQSKLLRECEDFARGRHELEPNAPDQLLGILFHELRRGHDQPGRAAANLRSLIRKASDFLSEAAETLVRPEPVWLRVMEHMVAGAEALLKGVEGFLAKTGSHPRDAESIKNVLKALHRYQERARDLPLAPSGSFAIGKALLERRVRDELGLDYSLGQIEALGLSEARRVGELLQAACRKFGKNRSADQILAEARRAWVPDRPLVELYRDETQRIARAFREAKAVTFPKGDELQVRPVPDFLRAVIPTAAYTQPGAFSRAQLGIFWVNDLSVTRKSESEKRAEQQQHFGIPLTCAHEAYPGHHLQFVSANRHPRKWRRLFAHAVFYEGWTLWCEQMTVDLKIDRSPWLLVQQLHDALWRCHRILVDLRLQSGRYSYEQGVRHLQSHLGFTRARAEAEINWYSGSPAVPMSYWLGRLENGRLTRRLVTGRGWSLKRFNDWLLSFGTIPQAWIEKYGLD